MEPNMNNTDYSTQPDQSLNEQAGELYSLIEDLIRSMTKDSSQIFFNLTDRLSYMLASQIICQEDYLDIYDWLFKWEFEFSILHSAEREAWYRKGNYCQARLIQISREEVPLELKPYLDSIHHSRQVAPVEMVIGNCRAEWVNHQNGVLEFVLESDQGAIIQISERDMERRWLNQLNKINRFYSFPIPVYLHDLKKEDNQWRCGTVIIFPDFLIDVTAVAECYESTASTPARHLISLYKERISSKAILIGTSANEFLDELILNPYQEYETLLRKVYNKFSLSIAALNEEDFNDFKYQSSIHYKHLSELVRTGFGNRVSKLEKCILEPSFLSVCYGLQGRLDILVDQDPQMIIELKSGRPYQTNSEGISASHHAQALMYHMLIESAGINHQGLHAWILYSVLNSDSLRPAMDQPSLRKQLLEIRNSIVLIHLNLALVEPNDSTILDQVHPDWFNQAGTFARRDGMLWFNIYSTLSKIEKKYFRQHTYFIARELLISKCGMHDTRHVQGLASMWRLSPQEKIQQYLLLNNLEISGIIHEDHDSPVIVLKRSIKDNAMTPFRAGDTMVLYPDERDGRGMLRHLVHKCTIIEIGYNEVKVRLRGRQFENEAARQRSWCLEGDSLERPFMYQFAGLFEFASAPAIYRSKILGIEAPRGSHEPKINEESIDELVLRAAGSPDYFLLWGPPGSGKTSVFLTKLINAIINTDEEGILLLAYTNRAVDEICDVIERLTTVADYIRIGSRYGSRPDFHHRLYDQIASNFTTRSLLIQKIQSTRIFTGTLASIHGKPELFSLKKFSTIIIDEASQILESGLIGLLSRFNRFILIGDHLQLPAVTLQTQEQTVIKDEDLLAAGMRSTGESLFERLFRQCEERQWEHAIGMLTRQGRMHEEIMKFPSTKFYKGSLQLVNQQVDGIQRSNKIMGVIDWPEDPWSRLLRQSRTIFIPVQVDNNQISGKSNANEGKIVSEIIHAWQKILQVNKIEWNDMTCGVITPFRVQISTIQNSLSARGLENLPITIDTVERYQGGARNIIIISTSISAISQLEQISSLNQDAMDRKLNVALTRAREQVVVVGNPDVLKMSPAYADLIRNYHIAFPPENGLNE